MIALTNQRGQDLVFTGHLFHMMQRITLRHRRTKIKRCLLADGLWHGRINQCIKAVKANGAQHLFHLRRRWADVSTVGEIIGFISGQFKRHARSSAFKSVGQRLSLWLGDEGLVTGQIH